MKQILLTPLLKQVKTTVAVPGSKSITNRALILASLCKTPVTIEHALDSDDTQALISGLQTLGIKIKQSKDKITVIGSISDVKEKNVTLHARLSGTAMRFLLALCCIVPGEKILTGEEGLCKRPVKDLVDALRQLGTKIEYLEQEGFPPVKITQPVNLKNGKTLSTQIAINGSNSSQFLSALLMILPLLGNTKIRVTGKLVSSSYIELTKSVIRSFGVETIQGNGTFQTNGTYAAKTCIVEGDYSAACYFAAIAALTKSQITIENLHPDSSQGDRELFSILESMGNKIIKKKQSITICGSQVKPVEVNMERCPDQIQTLSVLAAFAPGETKISGISTLRIKETDRLTAITTQLQKMGIETKITNDTLHIFGGNPHGALIDTYGDHRMAMAFAVAGTKIAGMTINNPDVVTKTFPNFWKELKKIGVGLQERKKDKQKIVLTGFMGAGKSSVAPLLAKKLGFDTVEMDELVLKRSKKKSIKEIFEKQGEKKFREIEQTIAKTFVNEKNIVISAGGGVIMNSETMDLLKENGIIVFLSTDFQTIENRLTDTIDRPLWKNKEQTEKLFFLRQPLYNRHADVIVSTDGKSLGKIIDEIMERIINL